MKTKLKALLSHRHMPLFATLAAIVLLLPTLGTGLMMDDHVHKMMFTAPGARYPGGPRGDWDLFRFLEDDPAALKHVMDRGMWPWWTVPGFRLAFFRPLASLWHSLDYRVFPDAHWFLHAESILTFAIAAFFAALFYRRLLGATVCAGLAALMFAVDDAHSMVIAWIANRHSIIAAAFGIAALVAHDKARQDQWKQGMVLGPLALALALLAGENGTSTLAYLFSYALILDRAPIRSRIVSLAPYAGVSMIWAAIYKLGGYGAAGGAFYIDPLRQMGDYLQAVVQRLPVLLAGQLAAPPADAWMMFPPGETAKLVGICAGILVVVAAGLFVVLRGNRTAAFFALGMTLSVLPACATWPGDRNLLFAGLGGFGLVAQLLSASREHLARPARMLGGLVAGIFIFLHLVVAPLLLPLRGYAMGAMLHDYTDRAIASFPGDAELKGKSVVVVYAPDSVISNTVIASRMNEKRDLPETFRVLMPAVEGSITVRRADDHTLSMIMSAGHLHEPTSILFRDPKRYPVHVGDRFVVTGMVAEIVTMMPDGQLPERIDFRFDKPLDDPSFTWVFWDKRQYSLLSLPRVGEERVLPVVPYGEAIGG